VQRSWRRGTWRLFSTAATSKHFIEQVENDVEGLSWSKNGSSLVAWYGEVMLLVLASRSSLPPPPAPPSSTDSSLTAPGRGLQCRQQGAASGSSTGVSLFLPSFFPLLPPFSGGGDGGGSMGGAVQGVAAGDSIYRAALGFPGRGMDGGGRFQAAWRASAVPAR
jgi:hypothetical protein